MLHALQASAQTPSQAQAPSPGSAGEDPQQVIVTATKRPVPQQQVAGTVSVARGDALEAGGARDIEDVLRLMPGLQVNKGDPDQSVPTVRGIGTVLGGSGFGLQQATTGIYVGDVPCTDPVAFVASCDLSPFDLDRVEALRGPQGVLFGSASLGGAVRYVLAQPDFKAQQFRLQSTLGAVAGAGVDLANSAMFNLPLGSVALRAVLQDRRDSGTVRNTGTGNDEANAVHQRGGRVTAAWKPTTAVNVSLLAMTQQTDLDDASAVDDPSRRERRTTMPSPRRTEVSLYNLTVDANLGPAVLTSSTAVLDKKVRARPDLTRRFGDLGPLLGLPDLPLINGYINYDSRAKSQELRLASAGGGAWSWLIGAFHQETRFTSDVAFNAPGGAALWGASVLPNDLYYSEVDDSNATETALFADLEWRLAPRWSLTAGARSYRNQVHFVADARLIEALLGPILIDQRKKESGATPRVSLKYSDGNSVWYATASQGYRLGGFNPGTGVEYKTDNLWNYETGVRLAPTRGLTVDATVFHMDWKDAQVNARQPGTIPLNGIANVGKARVQGLEFSSQWRVRPGTVLEGSLALTDAKTAAPFTSNNGALVASGTRMPGTPRVQSTLKLTQDFDGPFSTAGRWSLLHSHVGSRTLSLDAGGTAPGYGLLDTQASFSGTSWELTLFVRNVANRKGVVGGSPVSTLGGSNYMEYVLTRPRTIGASLRLEM
jgi:outer membrane receptor protein involved in Fe transport